MVEEGCVSTMPLPGSDLDTLSDANETDIKSKRPSCCDVGGHLFRELYLPSEL